MKHMWDMNVENNTNPKNKQITDESNQTRNK